MSRNSLGFETALGASDSLSMPLGASVLANSSLPLSLSQPSLISADSLPLLSDVPISTGANSTLPSSQSFLTGVGSLIPLDARALSRSGASALTGSSAIQISSLAMSS